MELERPKEFDAGTYERCDPAAREYMKALFPDSNILDEEFFSEYDLVIDHEFYELEMPGEDTWNLRMKMRHGVIHVPARKVNLVNDGWYYGVSPNLDEHYRVRIEKIKKCQTKKVWCKNVQAYDWFFVVPHSWIDWTGCSSKYS